jgi:hypothetical protein
MKRIVQVLVLCSFLTIWTASCKSIDANKFAPPPMPDTSPNWWSSWLVEPVCQLPCWQNITPGVTTIKEAISILENSPDIKIKYRVNNGIEWDFTQSKNGGGVIIGSQDGVIRSIELGGDSEILLEIIIASYGDPKYVKTYDCRNSMCATLLIYPDLGMLVDVFVENTGRDDENPQIEILPELVSNDVFFIEPGMENFQKITSFQDYGSPMEWKGYSVYP